jgi:FKBP-type peptidyl-prolyl cis-trans isomerase FkpA
MKKNILFYTTFAVLVCTVIACAQNRGPDASAPPTLETEEQKTLYALGLLLGGNIKQFALSPAELAIVRAGINDAATGAKPLVEINTYGPKVNELAQKRASAGADDAKKKGQEFADSVAKQSGATKTASGVVIRTITAGTGASPAATDTVKVHYEGKLIDGKVFDSSLKGDPVEFPLNRVVPCWTEALQQMKKGGKAQVVCPSSAAYGDRGAPPDIPPGATLSFEVELIDIRKP